MKRTNGGCEALKEAVGVFSFRDPDSQQYALVCCVQGFRQFLESTPNVRGKAITEPFNLAEDPSKPKINCENRPDIVIITTYIPSTLCESASTTNSLSSALHFRIFLSDWTAELM